MAKASLTLPNGTVVQIEGTAEEVRQLLEFYSSQSTERKKSMPASKRMGNLARTRRQEIQNQALDFAEIVNLVKDCDQSEQIETQIIDRSSQVNRTLLPLYIVHKYMNNAFGLTSGEISKITTDLGIPVAQPNASNTLSGTASRYVIGDKVKKKGQPVRYKLSRRGLKYVEAVLEGTENGE